MFVYLLVLNLATLIKEENGKKSETRETITDQIPYVLKLWNPDLKRGGVGIKIKMIISKVSLISSRSKTKTNKVLICRNR